jgi:branched-chain amino acid aminotransferase/4-amino-4-deoxychorismate lyase
MSKVLYNGSLVDESILNLDMENRAFAYADGFFETIVFDRQTCKYLDLHFNRITKAIEAFKFEHSAPLNWETFDTSINTLLHENRAIERGRIKIIFWRSNGGLYMPKIHEFECLAKIFPQKEINYIKKKVGIYDAFPKTFTPISFCKNIASNVYTFAQIAAKEKSYDDMIIVNPWRELIEGGSSNLFVVYKNTIYTPPIESGCIDGVMRSKIVEWCHTNSVVLEYKNINEAFIAISDGVFFANVTGIFEVQAVENIQFPITHPYITKLQAAFNLC